MFKPLLILDASEQTLKSSVAVTTFFPKVRDQNKHMVCLCPKITLEKLKRKLYLILRLQELLFPPGFFFFFLSCRTNPRDKKVRNTKLFKMKCNATTATFSFHFFFNWAFNPNYSHGMLGGDIIEMHNWEQHRGRDACTEPTTALISLLLLINNIPGSLGH